MDTEVGVIEQYTALPPLLRQRPVLYTPELGEQILAAYTAGHTLSSIARLDGMPTFQTILKWSRDDSKFAREFEHARQARAMFFEEHVSEIALDHSATKEDAPVMAIRLAALTKLCEWGDPCRYGKKVTVGGDTKRPIVFKVVTAIPDSPHQPVVELNPDGTQRRMKEPDSSEAEQPGGASPSALEDVSSIPTQAPDDEPPDAA